MLILKDLALNSNFIGILI